MKKRSLGFQIVLYFLTTSIMLLIAINIINYNTTTNIIKSNAEDSANYEINRSGSYIEEYIKKLKNTTNSLANEPSILKYINNNDADSKNRSLSLINSLLSADENLVSAILVTKDGRILSNEPDFEMKTSSNMMSEVWYTDSINNNGMASLSSAKNETLSSNKDTWVISVSKEILDSNNNNLAVLRLDISYKELELYLKQINLGNSGYSFIIDNNNNLVYHTNSTILDNYEEKENLINIANQKDGYISNDKLIKTSSIKNTNWKLVEITSLDRLTTAKSNLIKYFSYTAIISLIIALGGFFIVIKKLLLPIKSLQKTMKNFGNEEHVRAVEFGSTEMIDLAKQFNIMLDKIDSLMINIKEKEQDIRNYELQTLASQINPHFLYNTLDTIIWMAEFNDSEKVINITKSLANFFRLALNDGLEIITLEKEIDHIRQYLYIQKQRYTSKLNYTINEETEIKDFLLPKLVLQPIVENAIYHGIKELEKPGEIEIKTYSDENYIFVTIKDNGKGINNKLNYTGKKLGGVGIKNVDNRLKLYFGEKYSMDIESKENEYTIVKYKFPRE